MRRPDRASSRPERGRVAPRSWLWITAIASAVALAALLRAQGTARVVQPALPAPPKADPDAKPRSSSHHPIALQREKPRAESSMPPKPQSDAGASAPVQQAAAAEAPPQAVRWSNPPSAVASSPAVAVVPTASAIGHQARRVPRAALAEWLQPGLCGGSAEAARVRERLSSSFRLADLGEDGSLYLDPRLPPGAEQPVLDSLNQAEREVFVRLGLRPARPLMFVYADQPLMKASACINEDVVAFYDGALHVVLNRPDLLASVLHEYAHHALFSAGLMGPTWAQEGIAMHVAKETWWRDGRRLQALLDAPFAMDEMERAIAYKLKPEQAISFYVQSAALVECVLRERHWSLRELFATLSAGSRTDSVTYDLPELERRSFLSDCIEHGLNGVAQQ